MVFGRLREAASDVAETLRRAFSDPPCGTLSLAFQAPRTDQVPVLTVEQQGPDFLLRADISRINPHFPGEIREAGLNLEARLQVENGWDRWAAGAQVCTMGVFQVGAAPRVAVPPLPRKAATRAATLGLPGTRSRAMVDPLLPPRTRRIQDAFEEPRCFGGLQMALGLPVGVMPEAQASIPRALWMRYTLQLVKATDENIRNLDILGIYRIPTRGVQGLRHDAVKGRLLLTLGPEASGAPRGRLMLARSKSDRSLVSCFLEEADA